MEFRLELLGSFFISRRSSWLNVFPEISMKSNAANQIQPLVFGILFFLIGLLSLGLQVYFQHGFPRFEDWINYFCSALFATSGLTLVAYTQKFFSLTRSLLLVAILQFFSILALATFKPDPITCTYQSSHAFLIQSGLACRIPLGLILLLTMILTGVAYHQNKDTISNFGGKE